MNRYDWYVTPEEYAIAAANGISGKNVDNRIRKEGWRKQRAITEPLRPKKTPLELKYAAMAEANGINRKTFYQRLRTGWDMHKAATNPAGRQNSLDAFRARRKYPKELLELAEANGITYSTFISRIHQYKWSIQEAATRPPIPQVERSKCKIGNKMPKKYRKIT